MGRSFTKKQKMSVALVTERHGVADHIVPYSRGGQTTVENCQLISSRLNRKKGAFCFEPRGWQESFIEHHRRRKVGEPYLLVAVPGGGKTMATLEVCRKWLSEGGRRQVIVVVPTRNLKEQWSQEATRFGIDLLTKEFVGYIPHDMHGLSLTYQAVVSNSLVLRKICSVSPTLVVFDEVHHCGDQSAFGRAVKEAFDLSQEKLLLSGTPWKSCGTEIPYVKYDSEGYAVADFVYDHTEAIANRVIRELVFNYSRAVVINDSLGLREELSKSSTDAEAERMLTKVLRYGQYVEGLISEAHCKLLAIRKSVPDAAAMACCIDKQHAIKVASIIHRITGCDPSIILSDEESANDTVDSFRDDNKEWLVAVRQVSEGVDIKRLQVLAYLSNITTDLFFRQLIGRVSRVRGTKDREGYVYLPSDPRLIRCAETIENLQVKALELRDQSNSGELEEREPSDPVAVSYTTMHDGTDLVRVAGESLAAKEAAELERIAEACHIPMGALQKALAMRDNPVLAQQYGKVITKEDRMKQLRKAAQRHAVRLAKILNVEPAEIHARFQPPQNRMTEAELRRKVDSLLRMIDQAK